MADWAPIFGWEGLYEVSNGGIVRSLDRVVTRPNGVRVSLKGRELSAAMCNGYQRVSLRDGARKEFRYIHDLVCRAFHGPRPAGCEVAHGNNNRTDNVADNLRWATRAENIKDKARHGTQPVGERIWLAKLTDAAIRDIRSSGATLRALAAVYGVSHGTISAVKSRRTWKHVNG